MAKRKTGRKLVSVPNETYDALAQLQRELAAVTGQRVTIGDVVARGAQCLCDAHAGQTWLTPAEQEAPLRERVRTAVMSNLIALREQVPELGIGEIEYDGEKRCRAGEHRGPSGTGSALSRCADRVDGSAAFELKDGPRLMANQKAAITQAEIARFAKGMRAAGIEQFSIKVQKADGTKISIDTGKTSEAVNTGDDIDAMIARVPHAIP